MPKVPAHLIRPIRYPTAGAHPGIGAEYRDAAEIAEINDELRVPGNVAELDESYRVAGITPDGTPVIQVVVTRSLLGVYEEGQAGVLEQETPVEGGAIGHVRFGDGQLVVLSSSGYARV